MESLTVKLKSNGPMLMHSDRLCNPMAAETKAHKELTSKRKKTDEDFENIAKSEWLSSLYYNEVDGIFIPIQNIRKSLIEGARLNKLGKGIERGVVFMSMNAKLKYDGPKDLEKLWESGKFTDCRSVVVSRARLMRYRPIFLEWSTDEIELLYNEDVVNPSDIINSWVNAGRMIGLGDYRPLFGKYEVEVVD